MVKFLIVDDHPFIRSAIKTILEKEVASEFMEASNGAEAIMLARDLNPDIVILDLSMPSLDGLEVINRLKKHETKCKILVLTSLSPAYYASRCRKAGAAGFLCKTNELGDLIKAVKIIISGYTYFPNLESLKSNSFELEISEVNLIANLSNKEVIILQQLSLGYSNKEIGEMMLMSNKTVSSYKTKLLEKLNVKSVVALAEFSRRNNLI